MKLRLSSRRLASGRFQVNFSAEDNQQPCYGYLLADPTATVVDVIDKINRHVTAMQGKSYYFQRNLYSLHSRNIHSGRILLFSR